MERVACAKCSVLILPSTAVETGGVCIPCKRGYRDDIERSKAQRIEQKKYERSAERKHWTWLIAQVHGSGEGFDHLSAANQAFYAVCVLDGDVHRGGFESYFFNSSANYHSLALNLLMEIGATSALRIVIAAKEVLFGPGPLPKSVHARRAHLQAHHDPVSRAKKMALIDATFCKDPDELQKKIEAFAARHGLRRPFDE